MGRLFRLKGDHARSLDCHERTRRLAEELGSKLILAQAVSGIRAARLRLGDDAAAIEMLERAVGLWRDVGNRRDMTEPLLHLAEACLRLGHREQAVKAIREARSLAEECGQESLKGEIARVEALVSR